MLCIETHQPWARFVIHQSVTTTVVQIVRLSKSTLSPDAWWRPAVCGRNVAINIKVTKVRQTINYYPLYKFLMSSNWHVQLSIVTFTVIKCLLWMCIMTCEIGPTCNCALLSFLSLTSRSRLVKIKVPTNPTGQINLAVMYATVYYAAIYWLDDLHYTLGKSRSFLAHPTYLLHFFSFLDQIYQMDFDCWPRNFKFLMNTKSQIMTSRGLASPSWVKYIYIFLFKRQTYIIRMRIRLRLKRCKPFLATGYGT